MELPPSLQGSAEWAAQGVPLAQLTKAVDLLSRRYRSEVLDGTWHVADDLAARAYLMTRLPATFGAVAAAMQHLCAARPDFQPATLLDVGSGPGTAFWAARHTWPALQEARLLEGSPAMRQLGADLMKWTNISALQDQVVWQAADVTQPLPDVKEADLVTLAYVLNELPPASRPDLLAQLWDRTREVLLIVEPGTTAGWERILAARELLLQLGGHLLAPCPHTYACPVKRPDWCHFAQRVPRSRLHRQGKGAELGWEDEKFIYLAVGRQKGMAAVGRVLSTPSSRSGLVNLKLCTSQGTLEQQIFSKRQGELYQQARQLDWGDALRTSDEDAPKLR